MSDIFGVTGSAIGAFGPIIGDSEADYAVITSGPYHELGSLIPDIVTEEIHHDEMQITQQPVELGAPVTDHAFMKPVSIEMHAAWSDSTGQAVGYTDIIYQALLSQQKSAQTFGVITRKRAYVNMLMPSLLTKTDPETWSVLEVTAACQEIIVASPQTTSTNSGPTAPSDGGGVIGTIASDGAAGDTGQVPAGQGTVTISDGVDPVPPGAMTPDANGNLVWPNSPTSGGAVSLQSAPVGTPTIESLTANQGV